MRFITTEFYYSGEEIKGRPWRGGGRGIGFSVLWFVTHTNWPISPEELHDFRWTDIYQSSDELPFPRHGGSHAIAIAFIDASLRGVRRSRLVADRDYLNADLARTIIESEVIIERSPIEGVSLASIIGNATYISLGTYVGAAIAGSTPWLMCITVPGGIILMGAAFGIAKGLSAGLSRAIERVIAAKLEP